MVELGAAQVLITKGIWIQSKCDWYEDSKKSTIFVLNLEKRQEAQNNKYAESGFKRKHRGKI